MTLTAECYPELGCGWSVCVCVKCCRKRCQCFTSVVPVKLSKVAWSGRNWARRQWIQHQWHMSDSTPFPKPIPIFLLELAPAPAATYVPKSLWMGKGNFPSPCKASQSHPAAGYRVYFLAWLHWRGGDMTCFLADVHRKALQTS